MNAWATRVALALERHPGLVDVGLTAVLLVAGLLLGMLEFRYVGQRPGDVLPPVPPTSWVAVAIVAIVTPLAWRRRAPRTVLALVGGARWQPWRCFDSRTRSSCSRY